MGRLAVVALGAVLLLASLDAAARTPRWMKNATPWPEDALWANRGDAGALPDSGAQGVPYRKSYAYVPPDASPAEVADAADADAGTTPPKSGCGCENCTAISVAALIVAGYLARKIK